VSRSFARFAFAFLTTLAAACAEPLAERAPQADPASARAAEAPVARLPELARPDPALTTEAPVNPPAASLYACPMHPNVRSNAPGQCPTCGMRLRPLAPPANGSRR